MKIPFYHVDAFTGQAFTGNPAGVCLLEKWLEDPLLQAIAAENNLPETAFAVPGGKGYELRWFTPVTEIDLCGHATLACAHVFFMAGNHPDMDVQFQTRSGLLTVRRKEDLLYMDFPARPASSCPVPENLRHGLGAEPLAVYKARDYLAVFAGETEIAALQPDFQLLAELDCFGIIATAAGQDVDFVSRFFAPGAGIPEDPVTGSSHCTLIPYWAQQSGKTEMTARQLSRRGGELICIHGGERVVIGGRAVLYLSGTIEI